MRKMKKTKKDKAAQVRNFMDLGDEKKRNKLKKRIR